MILLTSNGLSSESLINKTREMVLGNNHKKAAIIVTADNIYKEKNWNVDRLTKELKSCGLEVSLFDFDYQDISELHSVDVIMLNGGNPFYLLNCMRDINIIRFIKKFLNEDKLLIGISAGSLVLQNNLNLVNQYTPEMNFMELTNLEGLKFVDIEILPHYSRFIDKYDDFEEICRNYEVDNNLEVHRLDNGHGILFDGNIYYFIK